MLRWRLVCRSLWEPDCSERQAACHQRCSNLRPSLHQGGISHLQNVRRSRFFAFRAFRSARSDAGLVGLPPPSPVSYGATPRRAAAAWNIVHRSSMARRAIRPASERRQAYAEPGLTRLCRGKAGRNGRCSRWCYRCRSYGLLEWTPSWTTKGSAMEHGMEPGADRPAIGCRLS